jgi:predicted enzyme related to lactoylglutathione lyase
MANRITAWCIDCHDPDGPAEFWSAVLGWVVTDRDDDGTSMKPTPDAGWRIDFLRVPDGPKQTKNRIHLAGNATEPHPDAALERLVAIGATPVDVGQGAASWHVLADPVGNEFCLLHRRVEPETS